MKKYSIPDLSSPYLRTGRMYMHRFVVSPSRVSGNLERVSSYVSYTWPLMLITTRLSSSGCFVEGVMLVKILFLRVPYDLSFQGANFFPLPVETCTVFIRIVVYAPVYETEAMVHASKVSPKCTFSKKSGRFLSMHATVVIRNVPTNLTQ